jgi:hypothetical protein
MIDRRLIALEKQVKEIHETVVKGKPADDELLEAAKNVVEERYRSGGEWEDLSQRILELANIIEGG